MVLKLEKERENIRGRALPLFCNVLYTWLQQPTGQSCEKAEQSEI